MNVFTILEINTGAGERIEDHTEGRIEAVEEVEEVKEVEETIIHPTIVIGTGTIDEIRPKNCGAIEISLNELFHSNHVYENLIF